MSMDSMNDPVILSLLSGIVGSVIGSIFGFLGSFLITRYSIEESAKKTIVIETKKRKLQKKESHRLAINALLVEAKENRESIDKWEQYRGKFKFTVDSWTVYKSQTADFSENVQQALFKTYAEIQRANTIIDYDVHVPSGHGINDAEIERRVTGVKQALDILLDQLNR